MNATDIRILFCDDARREMDSRYSLMGVVEGAKLTLEGELLSKLCVVAFLSAEQGARLSDVEIEIFFERPGGEIFEHERFAQLPEVAEVSEFPSQLFAASRLEGQLPANYASVYEFKNIDVQEGCLLRVRAHRGGEEILTRRLAILPVREDESGEEE